MLSYLADNTRRMLRSSLGHRIMSVLGVACGIILVTFTAAATYFVYRTEQAAWQGRQGEAARSAAQTIAGVVDDAREALQVVTVLDLGAWMTQPKEVDKLLALNSALQEVVRVDAGGRVLLSAYRDRSVLAGLSTIPQSRWFLQARAGQPYLGPVQLAYDGQPYLLMSIPAPDGGVAAARVNASVLWATVADIRFGDSGHVYVVTRDGDIVAHTDTAVVLAETNIAGRPELADMLAAPGSAWYGRYTNFEGQDMVGATAPVQGADWLVVAELPAREAYAATTLAAVIFSAGLLVLMVLMNLAAAQAVDYLILRPMEQLEVGAARIGQGDFGHRLGLSRKDEIGRLAQAFDDMAAHLVERDRQVAAQTAALQDSQARFQAIVEDQTELICRYLPDSTMIFVNEAYCRFFGQSREALLGRQFMPLIVEADRQLVAEAVAGLSAATPMATVEHRVVAAGGRVRWVRWLDRAILGPDGRIVEFQSVGQDITEQRAAEMELRASEERLRRITDNMFDVITQIDASGIIEYASPSHRWVIGLEPQDVIGHYIFERLHPDDANEAIGALSDALNNSDARRTITLRYQHADGHYLWMEANANFLYDAQGQIAGMILSSRDVTERRAAENALRDSEAGMRRITDNMFDVISQVDASGVISYASPSYRWVVGLEPQAVLGRLIFERLHPDDLNEALEAFSDALVRSDARRTITVRYQHADGHYIWMEVIATFLLDDQGDVNGMILSSRDITHRRQMESALRENERLYRLLAENSSDMIWIRDLDLRLTYLSPAVYRLRGFTVDEAMTQSLDQILSPGSAERARKYFAEMFKLTSRQAPDRERGGSRRLELEERRKDGSTIWTESVMSFLYDERGQPTGIQGVTRDITERRQAAEALNRVNQELEERVRARTEELLRANASLKDEIAVREQAETALRDSEIRLRRIADNMMDLIVQVNILGEYEYVSPSYRVVLGHAPEALLGRSMFEFVHPDDFDKVTQIGLGVISERRKVWLVTRFRNAAGDYRWLEAAANPLFDEAGAVIGAIVGSRDITERKQAEEALRLSEEKNRAIVDAVPDMLFEVDGAGRVLDYRAPNLDSLFAPPSEFMGRPLQEILPEHVSGPALVTMTRALESGEMAMFEYELESQGQLRYFEDRIVPLGPDRLLFVVRDITDRWQAENALRLANQDLERRVSERTQALSLANAELLRASQAKDDFLASMSHELRTPLNAILTLTESLGEGIYDPLTDRQRKPLHTITQSGLHLLQLINDILSLAKINAGRLELSPADVSVSQLCRASLQLIEAQARSKHLSVTQQIDAAVQTVWADERQLKQMLVNLLSNAVKFTPQGGAIGMNVDGDAQAGQVTFTVWDTGIGIPAEDQARLFKPFVQLDSGLARQYEGTGLGLALVRSMAELHGGSVSVVSAPGQGSRFSLKLPWSGTAEPGPVQAPAEGPEDTLSAPADAPLLLLAEDNAATQSAYYDFLTARGYRLSLAANGDEALALARALHPDGIIMDIQMPGKSGLEVIRTLRADEAFKRTPIVALTALAMPGDRERCLAAGADDYLAKPVRLKSLASVIGALLNKAGKTPAGAG